VESAKDFINEMMVEEIDGKEFVEAALAHNKNRKIRGFKRSSCRSSKKTSRRPSDYMPQVTY
jgi:hypothetical protein